MSDTKTETSAEYEIRRLMAYLSEIAKGAGPYSRDPLTHADNCIEHMKQMANDAINGLEFDEDRY